MQVFGIGSCTFAFEVFALGKALERAVLPLTILTDNSGEMQGRNRGEVHCTSYKNPNADEWKKIFQAHRTIEK